MVTWNMQTGGVKQLPSLILGRVDCRYASFAFMFLLTHWAEDNSLSNSMALALRMCAGAQNRPFGRVRVRTRDMGHGTWSSSITMGGGHPGWSSVHVRSRKGRTRPQTSSPA